MLLFRGTVGREMAGRYLTWILMPIPVPIVCILGLRQKKARILGPGL